MDIVEALYNEAKTTKDYLLSNGEISLASSVDASLKKSLLLASASSYEKQISEIIFDFAVTASSNNVFLSTFVQKKGISRQFHSMFNWDAKNCNAFLGLFGDEMKKLMEERIANTDGLIESIKDFMEIGRERNRMVHQDFGQYTLEKTVQEIFALHQSASEFIKVFEELILTNPSLPIDPAPEANA